tara:strand:+ start:10170 stop:10331 length:162 start_codon:yes stop_codon:yes gene_type:complete
MFIEKRREEKRNFRPDERRGYLLSENWATKVPREQSLKEIHLESNTAQARRLR